jgi:general secretion pathway protein D
MNIPSQVNGWSFPMKISVAEFSALWRSWSAWAGLAMVVLCAASLLAPRAAAFPAPPGQDSPAAGSNPLPPKKGATHASAPAKSQRRQNHPARQPAEPAPEKSTQPPAPSNQKPAATPMAKPPESTSGQAPASPEAGPGPEKKQAAPPAAEESGISFHLENADLLQFVNLVAAQLKMNYVVDPTVKGTVTITTRGQLRLKDLFSILQSVLEMNGATAIQIGNFFRVVPLSRAAKTPVQVLNETSGEPIPEDDRMVMMIVPLRFVFAGDMAKLLTPFLSDGGTIAVHEAGNVLILMDDSLNVKRLMDIVEQFDSASFARQRIRLIPVQNNVASGLVPELESIFAAYAYSDKSTPLRFVALDRINSILVVTSDPSAFAEVEEWVKKLDQPAPPSGIQTFIYRVKNSEANYLARLLTNIHRQGGGTSITEAPSMSGRSGGGGGGGGRTSGAGGQAGGQGAGNSQMEQEPSSFRGTVESGETSRGGIRITTDPVNNSLIIQCTAQQYAQIAKTLTELDVMPREVMIEARVYEVTLTGNLSFGLEYYLQQRDNTYRQPLGSFTAANALQASVGTLVGQTRELLTFLNASDNRSKVRVLSAPTVLAMDNSTAKIQVGSEVPILTSEGVVPVQSGGSSLFSNTIQNKETGIILTVVPRITSTGLISLSIAQEISNAQAPTPGSGIQSPSFLKRMIDTNVVVGNDQTIALGGLMQETINTSRNRIPLLGDIPALGALFGSTSYSRTKTELIVLLTPHIVKTIEEARTATDQLREGLLDLQHSFKKDKFVNP